MGMKRFRVVLFDFDSRALQLTREIQDNWEEKVKKQHFENRKKTEQALIDQFGKVSANEKKQNFIGLGNKPFSILAFHNRFFDQIRTSFIMGAYYPALTGACALGERILNHLVLILRDEFKSTPEYKKVYRKESFDNWDIAISTLFSWKVLLPQIESEFRNLSEIRNRAIHFRPEIDTNDRSLAADAIRILQTIIGTQFSGFGNQPWFLTGVPGEIYIKNDWEKAPFVNKVYLPNCAYVGPGNKIEELYPRIIISDLEQYPEKEISDDEFVKLRLKNRSR